MNQIPDRFRRRTDPGKRTRFERPFGADWFWRPPIWSGGALAPLMRDAGDGWDLCDGLRLFHDADDPEITIGQTAARDGLRLEVDRFDGSYVSLALAVSKQVAQTLTRFHLISLRLSGKFTVPEATFGRLNVVRGANCDTLVEGPLATGSRMGAEFDLAYLPAEKGGVKEAWVDLIFDKPTGLRLEIRDLVLTRLPRAEF